VEEGRAILDESGLDLIQAEDSTTRLRGPWLL